MWCRALAKAGNTKFDGAMEKILSTRHGVVWLTELDAMRRVNPDAFARLSKICSGNVDDDLSWDDGEAAASDPEVRTAAAGSDCRTDVVGDVGLSRLTLQVVDSEPRPPAALHSVGESESVPTASSCVGDSESETDQGTATSTTTFQFRVPFRAGGPAPRRRAASASAIAGASRGSIASGSDSAPVSDPRALSAGPEASLAEETVSPPTFADSLEGSGTGAASVTAGLAGRSSGLVACKALVDWLVTAACLDQRPQASTELHRVVLTVMFALYRLRYRWSVEHCIQQSEHVLVNYYFNYSLDIVLLASRVRNPACLSVCKG